MSNISAEEFDSLTKQFFGFLIDEYHFVLKKKNDLSYDFETATTRVSIFVEYNTVVVGMVPIGEEDRKLRQKNILPEQLGVTVVARGVQPNLDYKVIWDEPIAAAMERKSQILKNYCQDFLRGDFTKWTDVLEAKNKRS
jgi:hypothetical protein